MCTIHKTIDVPFNTPVITSQASGIILRTVIEFLVYYTKQTPFPFDALQVMASKLRVKQQNYNDDDDGIFSIQMNRQINLALDTFTNLKTLLENVASKFDQHEFHQALILFGATSQTPKEACLIKMPDVTKDHRSINHQDSIRNVARAVLMSIVTSQNLFEIESKLNTPTNMFVLLNPKNNIPMSDDLFQLNDGFRLPRSCKTVFLNLMNNGEPVRKNCCKNLAVYDDMLADYSNLNVKDKDLMEDEKPMNDTNNDFIDFNHADWYESTDFVRGFKDTLVKGKSIWND